MPLFTEQESLDLLLDSIPGSRELLQSEEEEVQRDPEPDFLDLIPQIQQRVTSAAEALYPTNPLNTFEMQRLGELSGRMDRLQDIEPFQHGALGSAAIPGNPYSIDTRGAAQGIGNLAVALMNRRRRGQRDEIEPAFTELAQRHQQTQDAQESQQQFFERFFPDVFREAGRQQRADADRTSREEIAAENRASREAIEAERNRLRSDPNNPETQRMYISAINNYVKTSHPGLELIPNQINNIMRAVDFNPGEEERQMIDQLEREYKRQSKSAAQMYADMGVIPKQPGLRDATDEEFNRIATMKLRGVPQDIISDYARDLGIRYIPPEGPSELEQVDINPEDATLPDDPSEITDFSDIFGGQD